jgi:hypothetical protein
MIIFTLNKLEKLKFRVINHERKKEYEGKIEKLFTNKI